MALDHRNGQILFAENMTVRHVLRGNHDGGVDSSRGNGLPLRAVEIRQVDGDKALRHRGRARAGDLHRGASLVGEYPLPAGLAFTE